MNEQEYKVNLLNIASEVRNICRNTENKNKFREMIKKFFRPKMLFLPEDYNKIPHHITKLPLEKKRSKDYLFNRAHLLSIFFPLERPTPEPLDEERLIVSYNLLTILHDKIYEYNPLVNLISDETWRETNAAWVEPIWEQIQYDVEYPEMIDMLKGCLEQVKADPAGEDGPGGTAGDKQPDDSMTLTVAVSIFHVSKTTIRRAIKDQRLKDYSDKAKSKNSPVLVSEKEVAKHWKRK